MKPILFIQFDKVHSIDSSLLADKELTALYFNMASIKATNIYIVSVIKKFRFDLKETSINDDFFLRTKIVVGNQPHSGFIFFPETKFKKVEEGESTPRKIVLTLSNGQKTAFTSHAFVTGLNLDFQNNPEIIYVGQSNQMIQRIKNHEKIIQSFAGLNDDEDVVLNFINLSFAYTDVKKGTLEHFNKETFRRIKPFGFTWDVLIDLAERVVINFFQPRLNVQHNTTNLDKDKTIRAMISKYGISKIVCGYELDGHNYQFWSPKQRLSNKLFNLELNSDSYEYNPEQL